MGLFTNALIPSFYTLKTDLKEPTFTGYFVQSVGWLLPSNYLDSEGFYGPISNPPVRWEMQDVSAPCLVYGYYLEYIDPADSSVNYAGAETFDTPFSLVDPTVSLTVIPRLAFPIPPFFGHGLAF
jgi:hypothetical protein